MAPISIATRSRQQSLGYSNGCKPTQDWGSSRTVITLELINLTLGVEVVFAWSSPFERVSLMWRWVALCSAYVTMETG